MENENPIIVIEQDFKRSFAFGAISGAIAKAQGEILNADKNRLNPHFKSTYADLSAVWDACRSALSKNEIAVIQTPSSDGDLVSVTTLLSHPSEQWIQSTLSARANKGDAQGIGSIITYLRRFGLASMAGVAPQADDDDAEADAENTIRDGGRPPRAPNLKAIIAAIDDVLNNTPPGPKLAEAWKGIQLDGRLDQVKLFEPRLHSKMCEFYNNTQIGHEADKAEAAGTEATEAAEEEPGQEATGEGGDDDPVIEFPPSPPTTDEDAAGDEGDLPVAPSVEPEAVIFKSAADILAEVEAALIDCSTPGDIQKLEAAFADDFGWLSKGNMKPIDKAITARIDELAAKD